MLERLFIVDALHVALREAIHDESSEPLYRTRLNYGQERDLQVLEAAIRQQPEDYTVFVDLTCVQSLSDRERLRPIELLASARPIVLVLRQSLLVRNSGIASAQPCTIVAVDSSPEARVVEILGGSGRAPGNVLDHGASFRDLRRAWLNDYLASLLTTEVLRAPPEGRRYRRMPDSTLANTWIDVKRILTTGHERALEIAYLLVRAYTDDFREDYQHLTILTGNNTSAVLATLMQALLGPQVRVAVVDRLGPFPFLSPTRLRDAISRGEHVVVIEDVISTGREIDLLQLLAIVNDGQVVRVIALYDLDIARPILVEGRRLDSLCWPGNRIQYLRRAHSDSLVPDKADETA
ncbi:MAG: hypothetical protein KF689_14360 [Gemmatimonadaceae bacterium]|nr:hypothetical protein [Gemmatimonadaceae bacterium]